MKFSKYNIIVEMEWGLLLYNARNMGIVQIHDRSEVDKFQALLNKNILDTNDDMVRILYKRGFIVDDETDEYKEARISIEDYFEKQSRTLEIMLYVTLKCNFRCVYCFEDHTNECFSEENWSALYKYIEKSLEKNMYDMVNFSFFGGEPLLEINAILKFLDKLEVLKKKYPNVEFCHDMTTNGYLLTPNIYDKLVERNLNRFMITLDGFATEHNQTRPLAGGGGTWDKIVKHLEYIDTKKDNVIVDLRINVSSVNIKSIDAFTEWIYQKFSKQKFDLNMQPVVDFFDSIQKDLVLNDESSEFINVRKHFIASTRNLDGLLRGNYMCSTVGKSSYTIAVDGRIRKCEEAFGDKFKYIGYLSKEGELIIDNEKIKAYTQDFETENCEKCIGYPLCFGRHCPEKKARFPKTRPDCIYDEIESMIIRDLKSRFGKLEKKTKIR